MMLHYDQPLNDREESHTPATHVENLGRQNDRPLCVQIRRNEFDADNATPSFQEYRFLLACIET